MNLKNSEKALSASDIAHELSGSLGVIQTFISLLKKETCTIKNTKLTTIVNSLESLSICNIELFSSFVKQIEIENNLPNISS
jgi:hypothetical protein